MDFLISTGYFFKQLFLLKIKNLNYLKIKNYGNQNNWANCFRRNSITENKHDPMF